MGSVKGTEGDAEASGYRWVEEVIPAPRLKGQGKEIVQLELWRSDLQRAKTESWSEGA